MSSSSDSEDDVPLAARVAQGAPLKSILKGSKKEDGVSPPAKPKAVVKTEATTTKTSVKEEKDNASQPSAPPSNSNGVKKAVPSGAKSAATVKKQNGASTNTKAKATVGVKRERKTYEMPGQTRDTPDETDPVRKFYESLSKQKPDSAMAKKWLLQHGMLPKDAAEKLHAKLKGVSAARKKQTAAAGSATGIKRTAGSKSPVKRRKKDRDTAFTDGGL